MSVCLSAGRAGLDWWMDGDNLPVIMLLVSKIFQVYLFGWHILVFHVFLHFPPVSRGYTDADGLWACRFAGLKLLGATFDKTTFIFHTQLIVRETIRNIFCIFILYRKIYSYMLLFYFKYIVIMLCVSIFQGYNKNDYYRRIIFVCFSNSSNWIIAIVGLRMRENVWNTIAATISRKKFWKIFKIQ